MPHHEFLRARVTALNNVIIKPLYLSSSDISDIHISWYMSWIRRYTMDFKDTAFLRRKYLNTVTEILQAAMWKLKHSFPSMCI
jgi:hypothetical protein